MARSHASENRGVILSLLVYGRLSIRLAQRETSEGKSGHWKVIGWRGRKKMNSGRPAGPCRNSRQCCMFYCVVGRREDGWVEERRRKAASRTDKDGGCAWECCGLQNTRSFSTVQHIIYIHTNSTSHTHTHPLCRAQSDRVLGPDPDVIARAWK